MTRRAWGEGTYDYNETLNRWRWRGYYTINGERKRKEIIAKSRKELKVKVAKFLAEIENNVDIFSSITTEKWCEIWLRDIIKPSVKIRTYETYKATCHNHIIPNFGNAQIKSLQPLVIQQYLNSLLGTHAAVTVSTIRSHFIMMLNSAMEYGHVKINVARKTKPPKSEKREIIALTEEQTKKLIEVATEGQYICFGANQVREENEGMLYLRNCYHAVIVVAITTGMRQGEIFGLQWQNVDLENKAIRVASNMVTSVERGEFLDTPKTLSSSRNILIPGKTIDVLLEWKNYQEKYSEKWGDIYNNTHELVFTNSFGNMVSITNFTKRYFRKMIRASGISDDFTFHGLRHTHATQLLKNGVNVTVVSERLGHSATSVTMDIYAHALPDMQEEAVKQLEKIYLKNEE